MKKDKIEAWRKSLYEWIQTVETLIGRHTITKPIIGEKAGEVSRGWLFELILHVSSQHKRNEDSDGCLWHGFTLGAILLSWYFRTAFSKTCDPRRPKEERERAFAQLISSAQIIIDMTKFEITKKDKEIYNQEWDPLFELDYNDFKDIEKQVEKIVEKKVA